MKDSIARRSVGPRRRIFRITALTIILILTYVRSDEWKRYLGWDSTPASRQESERQPAGFGEAFGSIETAWKSRSSDVLVEGAGRVERLLPDDQEGSRHQRFILRLDSGVTVLVAHNIDLAPRAPVSVGDPVLIRGEYEWNEKGGVVHWTHKDPRGNHPDGFIYHLDQRYW